MPISVKELVESEKLPLADRIFRFLREHSDQAFTSLEILSAVEGWTKEQVLMASLFWDSDREKVTEGVVVELSALQKKKRVFSVVRRGETYWAATPKKSR